MSFEIPSNDRLAEQDGKVSRTWGQWLSRTHDIVVSLQQSGPTADRPTKVLWLGRRYWDADLNKPVWVSSVKPTVWRDAMGNIV